jgi:protein LTV1
VDDGEYEDMSEDEGSVSSRGGCSSDGEEDDSVASLGHEETKSRFTEFSMSSSVVPRNDQLTLLDDRFEKVRRPFVLS